MKTALLPRFMVLLMGVTGFASATAPLVNLSTDKEVYLENEPVFLGIHQSPAGGPAVIGAAPLELGDLILEITPPDGKTYDYHPPMTICRAQPEAPSTDRSVFHTLVAGNGKIVTAASGLYVLRILDPQHNPLGPVLKFTVVKPYTSEDLGASALIKANPGAYAAFMFLEGGDHIPQALEVYEQLAKGNSAYAPTARALLSINYSQDMVSGRDGNPRKKDFAKMEKYMLDSFDGVNDYLKGRMLAMAGRKFGKEKLSPGILAKLRAAKKEWNGKPELARSEDFKQILEY